MEQCGACGLLRREPLLKAPPSGPSRGYLYGGGSGGGGGGGLGGGIGVPERGTPRIRQE